MALTKQEILEMAQKLAHDRRTGHVPRMRHETDEAYQARRERVLKNEERYRVSDGNAASLPFESEQSTEKPRRVFQGTHREFLQSLPPGGTLTVELPPNAPEQRDVTTEGERGEAARL